MLLPFSGFKVRMCRSSLDVASIPIIKGSDQMEKTCGWNEDKNLRVRIIVMFLAERVGNFHR